MVNGDAMQVKDGRRGSEASKERGETEIAWLAREGKQEDCPDEPTLARDETAGRAGLKTKVLHWLGITSF